MRKLNNIAVLALIVLAIAGNTYVCLGNDLPAYLSRTDSIPKSRDGITNPAMSWMYVQEKPDGTCHAAYNRVLKIHYEEPYAVSDQQRLRFRIYDQHRNVIVGTNEAGIIDNANCPGMISPRIKIGENWLTIDLLCSDFFDDHYYYLEVWNGKGEISYLRFICLQSPY